MLGKKRPASTVSSSRKMTALARPLGRSTNAEDHMPQMDTAMQHCRHFLCIGVMVRLTS